ncbi:2-hydroxyacyl-CoA dehydratase, partial [Chloroflexota bacterium]
EWVKDFNIDGVVEMPVWQNQSRLFRSQYFHRSLEFEGIPSIDIIREYHLANVGQISTRVEAFIEMLKGKKI